jgi:hypothetical protein
MLSTLLSTMRKPRNDRSCIFHGVPTEERKRKSQGTERNREMRGNGRGEYDAERGKGGLEAYNGKAGGRREREEQLRAGSWGRRPSRA